MFVQQTFVAKYDVRSSLYLSNKQPFKRHTFQNTSHSSLATLAYKNTSIKNQATSFISFKFHSLYNVAKTANTAVQLKCPTNLHPNPCGSKYWHIFGRARHGNKFNKQSRAITVGWGKQRHEDHVSDSLTAVSTV